MEIRIKSLNGYVKFDGVLESENKTIQIHYTDGNEWHDCIECTLEHRILDSSGQWVYAKDITLGQSLWHETREIFVYHIEHSVGTRKVYDIVNAGDDNCYQSNFTMQHNCVMMDEFAFVPRNIQELFFRSTLPVISSGKTTKIIMVSTPNGMEMFYKIWTESDPESENPNGYARCESSWWEMPGRDDAWKEAEERRLGPEGFRQEYGGEFLGSQNTLIDPIKISTLAFKTPSEILYDGRFKVYERPQDNHNYCICVDSAYGKGGDYSAFVVIDVTAFPYRLAAVFRDNRTSYLLYPDIIAQVGMKYHEAPVLCEVNDVGLMVSESLMQDLEYENILSVVTSNKHQEISGGFNKSAQPGLKMSMSTKRMGCAGLKVAVERDQLIIEDFDTIAEISTFVSSGKSFEADDGCTDDIVMCLVMFSWLMNQQYFKDLVSNNIRDAVNGKFTDEDFEEITPFGIIDDGVTDYETDEADVFFKGYPKNTL